jgi:hypothetical protein
VGRNSSRLSISSEMPMRAKRAACPMTSPAICQPAVETSHNRGRPGRPPAL